MLLAGLLVLMMSITLLDVRGAKGAAVRVAQSIILSGLFIFVAAAAAIAVVL